MPGKLRVQEQGKIICCPSHETNVSMCMRKVGLFLIMIAFMTCSSKAGHSSGTLVGCTM